MNLFSSDVYLDTLAEVYFHGQRHQIEIFHLAGKYFRLLVIDGEQVVTRWPFLDFHQPLQTPPSGRVNEIDFVPSAVLETTLAEDWRPPTTSDVEPAPFIDWRRFADWTGFEAMIAGRRSNLKRESRRKTRGLETSLGRLAFVLRDRRPEVFDRCVQWKSDQYVRTGLDDMFANSLNVRMFRELHRKGVLIVSSLSAGEQLVAAHFGALIDGEFCSWVAAYDPRHSTYSPGALLLEFLLAESWGRKDREFNFLIGDHEYKWFYATHNRVIGNLGSAPISLRLANAAKRPVRKFLGRHPRLHLLARRLKRGTRRGPD